MTESLQCTIGEHLTSSMAVVWNGLGSGIRRTTRLCADFDRGEARSTQGDGCGPVSKKQVTDYEVERTTGSSPCQKTAPKDDDVIGSLADVHDELPRREEAESSMRKVSLQC